MDTLGIAPAARSWPDPERLEPHRLWLDYDRDSDTLVGYFEGRPVPSYADQIGGQVFALVRPDTEEVVGFQVEEVLAEVVPQHPSFLDHLVAAELSGITPSELRRLRADLGLGAPRERLDELIPDLIALAS